MNDNSSILETCPHCGVWHSGRCPQIRSIEYFPNGIIKKITYENGQQETIEELKDRKG